MRLIGLPAMIVTVALMGVAYMLYVPPGQLVPALHSYWLTIHVTSMATSSAILSFSFFFGMAYLARRWADNRAARGRPGGRSGERQQRRGRDHDDGWRRCRCRRRRRSVAVPAARALATGCSARFPRAGLLDSWSYRFVMIGFPIWTFGVICGAIWGEHAWGRYWGWDPEGDVRLHHLGDLRDLPPRTRHLRLEGEARGDHHRVRVRRDPLHALRGQPLDRRAALVRSRLTGSSVSRASASECARRVSCVAHRNVLCSARPVARACSHVPPWSTGAHQKRTRQATRLPAASPPRLLQHLLMLVLAHLLAPLLDYRTHLARTIAVRGDRRPRADWRRWSRGPAGSTLTSPSTGMKLVSPAQRGTTCTWTCSTLAPAAAALVDADVEAVGVHRIGERADRALRRREDRGPSRPVSARQGRARGAPAPPSGGRSCTGSGS